MIVSPFDSRPPSSSIVDSVGAPDGTITHTARGGSNALTRSASDVHGAAPSPCAASSASALRSWTTTWWPPSMSRLVMLPPMRPRPTIPIFMCSPDLVEGLDRHPQHPAPVVEQALVVAQGLGGDQSAEVVRVTGNGKFGRGPSGHDLHGDDLVGASLVQLARRVQEPGPVPARDGDATEAGALCSAEALELVVLAVGQVGLDRH